MLQYFKSRVWLKYLKRQNKTKTNFWLINWQINGRNLGASLQRVSSHPSGLFGPRESTDGMKEDLRTHVNRQHETNHLRTAGYLSVNSNVFSVVMEMFSALFVHVKGKQESWIFIEGQPNQEKSLFSLPYYFCPRLFLWKDNLDLRVTIVAGSGGSKKRIHQVVEPCDYKWKMGKNSVSNGRVCTTFSSMKPKL